MAESYWKSIHVERRAGWIELIERERSANNLFGINHTYLLIIQRHDPIQDRVRYRVALIGV